MTSVGPHYTVLRIKRKIDAEPLTSLFIEESDRAKKRAKDSSHDRGVFMLAETATQEWDPESQEAQALQQRILQMETQRQLAGPSSPLADAQLDPSQYASRRYRVIRPQPRSRSAGYRASPAGKDSPISKLGPQGSADGENEAPQSVTQTLRFIDAHEVHSPAVSTGPSTPIRARAGRSRGDGVDDRYHDLLAENLAGNQAVPLRAPTLADRPLPRGSPQAVSSRSGLATPLASPAKPAAEEGIFVYDLYYKVEGAVASRDAGNVGALMGYDDLFDDEGSDSEPEPGDEADEDSNEEDFYRNDYPEEDVSSGADDLEEPDRETYLQPVAHRRVYKYGDEADSDRDGFASSDDEDDDPAAADGGMSKAFQKAFGLGRHSGLDEREDGDLLGDEDDEMEGHASDGAEEIGEVDAWRVMRDDE